jgi:multidrug efflux pump subunit AcrA (membrane-fusion protein)
VTADQVVRIRVDAMPDEKRTGKILSVGSVLRTRRADTPVKGVDVIIAFDEKVGKMASGMTATGQIEVERIQDVLLAPVKAVRETDGRTTVKILNSEGHAEEREIRVGRRNQQFVEVIEGLSEGERLMLE